MAKLIGSAKRATMAAAESGRLSDNQTPDRSNGFGKGMKRSKQGAAKTSQTILGSSDKLGG